MRVSIYSLSLAVLSLAAHVVAAQTIEPLDIGCRGQGASGEFEIGIVVDTHDSSFDVSMTDMTTGDVLDGSPQRISWMTPPLNECHYRAYVCCGGGEAQDSLAVVYQTDRLYRLDIKPVQGDDGPSASYYVYFLEDCPPGSSVFCLQEERGNYDTVIFIRSNRIQLYPESLPEGYGAPMSVEDYFPEKTRWVLPYDYRAFYSSASAPDVWSSQFFARAPGPGAGPDTIPVTLHASTGADWRLRNGHAWNWSSSDVSAIDFGGGGGVTVGGQMSVAGVALSARTVGQGWNGLSVPGGSLALGSGTIIDGVVSSAAVVVSGGGSATLDSAQVRNTSGGAGVLVSGKAVSGKRSTAHITGESRIYNNASGPSVRADAGAQVTIDSDDVEIYDNGAGIVATGTGSSVLVLGGFVHNNDGPGLRASSGAGIDVLRDAGGGVSSFAATEQAVRVWNNIGGLYATAGGLSFGFSGMQGGGVVWTGDYVCVKAPCASIGGHDFRQNTQPAPGGGPVYDALATGGSRVTASQNYWDGRTEEQVLLTSLADESSKIDVSDPLLTPPSVGGGASGRASTRQARVVRDGSAAPAAQRLGTGLVDVAVQALLAEADGLVRGGDSTLAAERITQAYTAVTSDDDRLAVAEAAGRALAAVEPPALVAWAETAASTPADRPWGRRALAAGLAGHGRTAEALVVAQALVDEDGAGEDEAALAHRARGLGLVTRASVDAGDAQRAVQALSDLAAVDPEGAEELALSVALAFPDAVVSFGRGAASVQSGRAASGSGDVAGKAGADTAPRTAELSAAPNPSVGAVRVVLVVAAEVEARVEVFDALGRRVALLHDGPASGAVEASFDGSNVPAGVYVVRAVVRAADGSSSVLARRVVVAR